MKGWKRPVWGRRKIRRKKNPETMEITYKEIRENKEINLLIEKGNQVMQALGYTEHSKKHAARVAETAGKILKGLGYSQKAIELSRIAGYMHDIGNSIGHHDESTGTAVDVVSAALILADKTDVRRNRVQNPNISSFDAHDRVNYAALSTSLEIKEEKKVIQVELELDDAMCTVMDYFEIFLQRMLMCKRAAEVLGCRFKLLANGSKLC